MTPLLLLLLPPLSLLPVPPDPPDDEVDEVGVPDELTDGPVYGALFIYGAVD